MRTDAAEAESAELAAIDASLQNPELRQAVLASQQGRSWEAKRIADAFLRKHPGDLLALTVAAEGAINDWEFEAAEAKLREVLDRAPSFLRASLLLARCLATQMRVRDAIAVLEHVVQREPQNTAVQRYLARLRADVGDHRAVADLYERILRANDAQVDDWITYAQYLRIAGRRDESLAAFRRALRLDPSRAAAWWAIAHYFPTDLVESDVERIRELLGRSLPARDAGMLHLALFILADRRGDHEQAVRELTAAARHRPDSTPYDPAALAAELDRVCGTFTPDFYAARASAGSPDRSPIFVIGMPRSGSTLVERILGRHSMIEGAGELQVMGRLAEQLSRRASPGGSYADLVASMPGEELTKLGEAYVAGCSDFRRTGKPMFVDKLNSNWLNIGLIRLILPDARIVDVRRNALDCCWSNFKMQFGDAHAGDLRHIALYYRDYVRFVDRIDAAAPGGILRVRYEDLVNDIEGETRRMLGFIGVEHEAQCIDFHLSGEPVATPSSEQVREPLHRHGIGAAEPYRPWLAPLIEELGPLATET